jgi:hypothetical protein
LKMFLTLTISRLSYFRKIAISEIKPKRIVNNSYLSSTQKAYNAARKSKWNAIVWNVRT